MKLGNIKLQSLSLNVQVLDEDKNEIDLKQTYEEDEEVGYAPAAGDEELFNEQMVADTLVGFGLEDENGEAIVESAEENFADDENL